MATIPEGRTGSATETTRGYPLEVPPTDIYETEAGLILLVDLPGADAESVSITLDKRVLTISAYMTPDAPTGYTQVLDEIGPVHYERAFALSEQYDEDSIEAVMNDGVLKIVLKRAAQEQSRTIKVRAG